MIHRKCLRDSAVVRTFKANKRMKGQLATSMTKSMASRTMRRTKRVMRINRSRMLWIRKSAKATLST